MADRGRRRFAGARRERAHTGWTRSTAVARATIAPATKVLLGSFVLGATRDETVLRTRGLVAIASDQAVTVEDQVGAYGLVVVSDLALAAGAASIPGPVTDESDDGWFVWVPFGQQSQQDADGISSLMYPFDSKAMRRIEDGYGVAIMIENASATAGLQVLDVVSLLSKLS